MVNHDYTLLTECTYTTSQDMVIYREWYDSS